MALTSLSRKIEPGSSSATHLAAPKNFALIFAAKDSSSKKFLNLRIRIRVKLCIAITLIIWLKTLILSFMILARQKSRLYSQTVRFGKLSPDYFAGNANFPLLDNDILRLNRLIKESAPPHKELGGKLARRSLQLLGLQGKEDAYKE